MTSTDGIDPLSPVHPGEMLAEEFLAPLGLSAGMAAARMGVPPHTYRALDRPDDPDDA